jgi:hypothetical protein
MPIHPDQIQVEQAILDGLRADLGRSSIERASMPPEDRRLNAQAQAVTASSDTM